MESKLLRYCSLKILRGLSPFPFLESDVLLALSEEVEFSEDFDSVFAGELFFSSAITENVRRRLKNIGQIDCQLNFPRANKLRREPSANGKNTTQQISEKRPRSAKSGYQK